MSELPTNEMRLELRGLEVGNLLAVLALLGTLRALEAARPTWAAKASWVGPLWKARLHLDAVASQDDVTEAIATGIEEVAAKLDVDGRANVGFESAKAFRTYAERLRRDPVVSDLPSALTAELPSKRNDAALRAAPLVMMFGQGHQNFLERLVSVSRGELPNRHRRLKQPPDMRSPAKVAEALFDSWQRRDDADGFRWDPADDQRYALRFDDPSDAGAAPTVHGANRLAVLGFLSFACCPGSHQMSVRGCVADREGVSFVWPVWTEPLSLKSIERLLSFDAVLQGRLEELRPLGIVEVYRARRVSNGKFMNVTVGQPAGARRS
jgi:hypothetical protein